MKRLLVTFLKIGISAAIIGYLVYDAMRTQSDVFTKLLSQPKRWDLLFAAWVCSFIAVMLTFIRWWYLVCTLGIPFRFRDSLRISFWGYLFNLAPLGIVGGDLVKAVMLDRCHPQNRAKALASVFADRVIGLYVLFVVASVAILATRYWASEVRDIYPVCMAALAITAGSTVGLAVALGPDWLVSGMIRAVGRIPRVGEPLESLIHAVRMYNRKPRVLLVSAVMTVGVHCTFAIACYLIACGLFDNHLTNLSLSRHFVVMPLSAAMQVIPVPIGPSEFAMNYLYPSVRIAGPIITKGQGLMVALVAYRLMAVLIAASGVFYYFGHGREMAEVIHEAEEEDTTL